ncbi:MAG: molybdenum ABC transporter substrate-binding protein [Sulfurovum sp. FS08-3]|nr:MAG: molybdenum ABC transporter substrate-binding protein [Sulfurovum sp. FS08-3]
MTKVFLFFVAFLGIVCAQGLKVGSGAGYKKPLMEVIQEYEKSGAKIEPFFGNMKQITTQATQTDIALIVGDKNFLAQKSGLDFQGFLTIGKGRVVVAYPKGKSLKSYQDLTKSDIQKISMPQPQKAIYGIAGIEFLKNSGIYHEVQNKLLVVATVPQAIAYVITREVDAAIVNVTAALANRDKLGGYFEIDEKFYTPIEIVAGKLSSCHDEKCTKFLEFLETQKAKKILAKYGL